MTLTLQHLIDLKPTILLQPAILLQNTLRIFWRGSVLTTACFRHFFNISFHFSSEQREIIGFYLLVIAPNMRYKRRVRVRVRVREQMRMGKRSFPPSLSPLFVGELGGEVFIPSPHEANIYERVPRRYKWALNIFDKPPCIVMGELNTQCKPLINSRWLEGVNRLYFFSTKSWDYNKVDQYKI